MEILFVRILCSLEVKYNFSYCIVAVYYYTVFIHISLQDFATSSLKGEVAAENDEEVEQMEDLQEYQIDERKQWEQK